MIAISRTVFARYAACYALYLVLIALCYGVFEVWRKTSLLIIVALLGASEAIQALYATFMVLTAMAMFGVVMAGEPFMREGVPKLQLWSRFFVMALPVGGVAAFGLALQALIDALT